MKKIHRERLMRLARWLARAKLRPGEKLLMSAYKDPTVPDTCGCAVHHAARRGVVPNFKHFWRGRRTAAAYYGYAATNGDGPLAASSGAKTLREVAQQIRRFLKLDRQ